LLLDISKLLSKYRRKARRTAEARGGRAALAGGGASREGSVSVGQCIALLEAEVEWKLTSTLIIFLARPRFESSDPPY
jgi:hypothetical protein